MQRATFHRSALVRLLSETHPQLPDPKYDFGERLGRWLDLSDAMTLFSVLGTEVGEHAPVLSPPRPSDNDLPDQLQRVRRSLRDAIANDGVFETDPSGRRRGSRFRFRNHERAQTACPTSPRTTAITSRTSAR